MFCYQRDHNSEVEVISDFHQFEQLIKDQQLAVSIGQCRDLLTQGDDKAYGELKRRLPIFIFQAAGVTPSPKNLKDKDCKVMGMYRRQANVILNGLCVLDIDHVDAPAVVWQEIERQHPEVFKTGEDGGGYWKILGAYVTPSNQGLKIVFTADPQVGNLADNQLAFSQYLGVENDKSIKDSSRGSFAVDYWNWLYMNPSLITYNNEDYDKLFGETYRKGDSRPVKNTQRSAAGSSSGHAHHRVDGGSGDRNDGDSQDDREQQPVGENLELKYGDERIQDISARYAERYGTPVEGDRHRSLIKVAGHFRYLVDNNPQKLKVALRTLPWVREWEQREANAREIDDIAEDVCGLRMWREIPKQLAAVLCSCGHQDTGGKEVAADAGEADVKHDRFEIWSRLQPLLEDDPLYTLCCSTLPDENKLAGVFVAGAMFDTLMSRCCYLHYDGKLHRLNPNVAVIGNPASGKSFADAFDDAIMAVMRAADEPGRRAEAEYKKEQKKRHTSNKAAKGEQQLKEPEECIRYIPSRTSNAVFYRRQRNAKELVNGEVMPLHLYTFDSELDSTVAAQSGGSWIAKHDLELKAFHNEKSGVDYANADSENDIITVYWNQVVTGTEVSLSKKINMRNVNDGLCSRIAFVKIANGDFQMLEMGNAKENEKTYEQMKKWGEFFDGLKGEIDITKLVKHCFTLCAKAAKSAQQKDDHILDYLRKRAVFYAEWFTLPRILARESLKDKKHKVNLQKPTIKQSDLDFAELIFDSVIYYQDLFFGKMLEEVWQNARNAFAVRRLIRTSRNEEIFETLPKEFNIDDVVQKLGNNKNAANTQINRWVKRNLCKKLKKNLWQKL